ncbi:MAG TPA: hypothetical protein VNE17_10030, partial [Nitrolancea sp.]|nr:hypothetical protein [Nitrolancea sp.]
GTTGDILLCDFTQYAVGMRSDYAVQSSPHLYFDYDVTAMRSIARATGLSLWSTPYTPTANGGLTLSPFVALATRS